MVPRLRSTITRHGSIYLVVALCILGSSYVHNVNLLILIFALLVAVALAGLVWGRWNLRGLDLSRRVPENCFAGEAFHVELKLEGLGRRTSAFAVGVRERLDPPVPDLEPVTLFGEIPAHGSRRARYRALIPYRGVFGYEAATLSTRFPFGLSESRRRIDLPAEFIVYPRIGSLTQNWRNVAGLPVETSKSRARSPLRRHDEYHGLREFHDNDNPRHIHWRATARRRVPMVKEFESADTTDTLLALDPWWPDRPGNDERRAVETLISFAATVCWDLCRRPNNRLVLAIAAVTPVVRHGHTSLRTRREFLRQLALATGSADANLAECLAEVAPVHESGMRVWFVSTRPRAQYEDLVTDRFGRRRVGTQVRLLNVPAGDLDDFFALEPAGV